MGLAGSVLVTAPPARGHVDATAVGGEPIVAVASKQTMIATRRRFFGPANVNPRTGAVRRNRVILSWFGVTNFAMAIDGRVVLLDAWVPRGAHSGYVPTSPQELAALRPEVILIGHAHFDHAADAVPIAAASGARLVGTAEHCSDFRRRAPILPPPCREVIPSGAPPGTTSRVKLAGVRTKVMKHLHSAVTGPDGYHLPVLPLPAPTTILNPPTPEDMRHLFGHLPDDEGGALVYRFRVGKFTLAWHDSSGPLIDRSPETLAALRRLGSVDVQVGAIQGFNQITNGMRDPGPGPVASRRLGGRDHHAGRALFPVPGRRA